MNLKKVFVLGMSTAMLLSFTVQAEAGFSWGGIANKVANKAVDGIFSGGSKKTEDSSAEKAKQEKGNTAANKNTNKQQKNASSKNQAGGYVPTAFYGELDPLPPADVTQRPDWFQKRRNAETMTNARLVAEYENLLKWQEQTKTNGNDVDVPDLLRRDELYHEISKRVNNINNYVYYTEADAPEFAEENLASDFFKRGVASNIKPLYKYGLNEDITGALLPGYHPERN